MAQRSQPRRLQQQQRGLVVARAGTRDPFEVLGVGRGADAKAIKAAYRRKALKLHPDVNKAVSLTHLAAAYRMEGSVCSTTSR